MTKEDKALKFSELTKEQQERNITETIEWFFNTDDATERTRMSRKEAREYCMYHPDWRYDEHGNIV